MIPVSGPTMREWPMLQRLSRLVVASGAALLFAGVIVVAEAVPAAAADITTCPGTLNGSTYTLNDNCVTTASLTVPRYHHG